jgi:hypothetical protein
VPDAQVGQWVNPSVEVQAPKGAQWNPTYLWAQPPGKVFVSFNVSSDWETGEVKKYEHKANKRSIQFVWADGGNGRQVAVTVTIKGVPITRSTRVNVKVPTSEGSARADGQPKIGNARTGYMGLLNKNDNGNGPMRFTGSVDQPLGLLPGYWHLVQLWSYKRTSVQNSDKVPRSVYGLDNTYPYSDWEDHYTVLGYEAPGWPADGRKYKDSDAPDSTPGKNDTWAEMDDVWQTWIMYRPLGGEWVPLRRITWSVKCKEHRTGNRNPWTLVFGTVTTDPADGRFSVTTDHPQWKVCWVNSDGRARPPFMQ